MFSLPISYTVLKKYAYLRESGVYIFINDFNAMYIGSAINMYRRLLEHLSKFRSNTNLYKLQEHIKTIGGIKRFE